MEFKIFRWIKTKQNIWLTRENRNTWTPSLNFNNRVQEYSPKTSWFYSKKLPGCQPRAKIKDVGNGKFLKRGAGRFYLCKKNKAKKFTSYFIKTYCNWGDTKLFFHFPFFKDNDYSQVYPKQAAVGFLMFHTIMKRRKIMPPKNCFSRDFRC